MKKNISNKSNAVLDSKILDNKLTYSNQELIILNVLIVLIPIALYFQSINFGFTNFDDDGIIQNNITYLENFDNASDAFKTDAFIKKISPFYRPLQTFSYMVDIKIAGGNKPWVYHLTNVLLLALISFTLFNLFKQFNIPKRLAFAGAIIYCVHPLFVSSVAWIPSRGDLLLTLFALLSFSFLINYLRKNQFLFLFAHWVTFTIALFCKETAAFLPFIYILYYLLFIPKQDKNFKHAGILALYGISGLVWIWIRSKAIGDFSDREDVFGLNQILSNIATFPEALSKFFLPFDFSPIPRVTLFKTLSGIIIMIGLGVLYHKNRKETFSTHLLFCITWFILLLAPTLLFKHKLIEYLDHRFFLPLVGIALFVLLLFPKQWLSNGDIKFSWIWISIVVGLSIITFIKTKTYTDPLSFYNAAVSNNPKSAIAYNNRGHLKTTKNNFESASKDFSKAIILCPTYDQAFNNRGYVKAKMGDNVGAIEDFNKAISLNNNYSDPYFHRGAANIAIGNNKQAIKDFDKYLTFNPKSDASYNYKGMAIGSLGNLNEAVNNFSKAIEINPGFMEAYGNRAIARFRLEDHKGALEDCNKVLQINPRDEKAMQIKKMITDGNNVQ